MKQTDFNKDWLFDRQGGEKIPVQLPHDAMIHETRDPVSPGGGGHGYFPGGVYVYEKTFHAPMEWKDQTVSLLFEGVYKNSTVTVNGTAAGGQPYGYTPFTVCLDGLLHYGGENTVTVTADNSQLPNSRWYSGSGIYRPVSLLSGGKSHIKWQGVKITTLSYEPAKIRVETDAVGGEIAVEILNGADIITSGNGASCELDIPNAKLWSDEAPNLYACRVTLRENGQVVDEVTEHFGIRVVEWSPKGLLINGKEILLRGGCVHHDSGILGAVTYAKSEERRVRIMKENGFNAIRSSHNPASRALLDACDKYGMYLMDETFDMWYNRKNKFDYGLDFHDWWESDTRAMVERDYNHPSVILYSIGNEVAEPCEEKGVKAGQAQIDLIHGLDATRPVTCGVNLMILGRAAKGHGIYQDGELSTVKKEQKPQKVKEQNASLMFNIIASFTGTSMNKGGNSPKVDTIASPFVDSLDIAGYNYGSGRYPLEEKQHPDRIIFGSETFPQDICKNWEMVKKYPYLVGDFMWTAWDYLGESGLGAWSYTGGMPFNRPYPWLLAGTGVIDILGIPDASCKYAATVWGLTDRPVIGVRPMNHPGVRVSKSTWRGTNAIESWAWSGCGGNKAEIEVYAQADSVELLLNGKSLGRKKLKEYKAMFRTKYAPGMLEAVAHDESGRELSRSELRSADGKLHIQAQPEEKSVSAGEIVYVPIALAGENGIVESNNDQKLTVTVENGELLAFGSANPCTEERYDTGSFTTYYGRALAIIRAKERGTVTITVKGETLATASMEISVM